MLVPAVRGRGHSKREPVGSFPMVPTDKPYESVLTRYGEKSIMYSVEFDFQKGMFRRVNEDTKTKLLDQLTGLMTLTAIQLPDDLMSRLRQMREKEENPKTLAIYDAMLENQRQAVASARPNCQDTGIVQCYVRAGSDSPFLADWEALLTEAVARATQQTPLRPNVIASFEETNDGTNVGHGVPFIEWDIIPHSSDIEMDVYFAGGGCSLAGRSAVLMPAAGYEGVVDFVLDVVCGRAVNACPPMVVGVGIGACITTATRLSKRALLRTIGSRNPNEKIARMEQLLFDGINQVNIGPQGLGGRETAIGVQIEAMARHPASLGVSVSIGCWVHRRSTVRVNRAGEMELLTHKGVAL